MKSRQSSPQRLKHNKEIVVTINTNKFMKAVTAMQATVMPHQYSEFEALKSTMLDVLSEFDEVLQV